jgi:low temperature requirement protein LtrA
VTHRATTFEIFWDLVLVFALTRVLSFMERPPTPIVLVRGLLLLALLWWCFEIYAWLGNEVRADVGVIRAGSLTAMGAIFLAALVIPDAWRHGNQTVAYAPLTLALCYIVIRILHLALYWYAAGGNRRLRVQVLLYAIPTVVGWVPVVIGAVLGGIAQILLWAFAFIVVDGIGARVVTGFGGFRVRSPGHFAERRGLVLIIALGESLISVGAGAGSSVTRWPVAIAALLGLTTAVLLWWLYFENAASPAGRALAGTPEPQRGKKARDAYTLTHFLLIAGIIYLDLGIEQVLTHLARNRAGHLDGASLDWTATSALYGGVVLYLTGRVLFIRLMLGGTAAARIVAVGIALALLPAARFLPAMAALGLLSVFLAVVVCYERTRGNVRDPVAQAAAGA